MIRRPPRSTLDRSSAASDVYKRQIFNIMKKTTMVLFVMFAALFIFSGGKLIGQTIHICDTFPADGVPKGENTKFSYDAVSYTHLRAHETVLDLVCRLLLEKKKNQ